jgi:signal transduction histidine kinase
MIGERGEAVGRRKDGTTFPMELVVSQATVGDEPVFIGIARDITERRLAEEAFRYLRQRLKDVQEAERRDIARELHDEIGQDLTGLKYLLDSTSRRSWDEVADTIARSGALVDALTAKVRDLSLSLRPSMLDDLGLLPALLWLIRRYTDRFGVDVSFEHVGLSKRFPPDVETAAYRIVQEGLTNIARHAAARKASLRVSSHDGTLVILIEDPGVGFETTEMSMHSPGIGLTGMRERAELLGGHLTVDSALGEGTRLKVEIPVKVDLEVAR